MIQFILIFQQKTGELLYSCSFQEDKNIDLFSSLISAIKNFTTESFSSEKESLKNIQIGEYSVIISQVAEISSDLIFASDVGDDKVIHKIIPDVIKIILNYKELFINLETEISKIQELTQNISKLISSNNNLIPNGFISVNQEELNKKTFNQKGSLISNIKDKLVTKERDFLNLYQKEDNYIIKHKILNELCIINKKLGEKESFEKFNEELNTISKKIKDQEIRLNYYLEKIKESLNTREYKFIYPFLYSFCDKLQHFGEKRIIEKYKKLAEIILNENKISKKELFLARDEISKMSFNPKDYFPEE